MAHDDFQFEPVRGLPELPPEGERILWQGAPDWRSLARRAYGARAVAIYFALLAIGRAGLVMADGGSAREASAAGAWLVLIGAVAVGILCLMAWGGARTTVYTITNRRVAMRIGTALSVTLNLPHRWTMAADLRLHSDGTGDLPLTLGGDTRLAYLLLWPHVRPWRMSRAEPALRCVPEAERVAEILSDALREASERRAAQSRAETFKIAAE